MALRQVAARTRLPVTAGKLPSHTLPLFKQMVVSKHIVEHLIERKPVCPTMASGARTEVLARISWGRYKGEMSLMLLCVSSGSEPGPVRAREFGIGAFTAFEF